MAGRGKPRSQLTFNPELLGVGREQPAPSSVLDPPPVYPPLHAKPKVPPNRSENIYLSSLAKDFVNRMQDSPFNVNPCTQQLNIKEDPFATLGLDPNRFPSELVKVFKNVSGLKGVKRKNVSKPNLSAKRAKVGRTGDINSHLDKLEAKEGEEDDSEVKEGKGKDSDKENDGEGGEEDIEDIDDEEMDDETDYARDYFDNGEGYLDEEDDNLDEGGIY